jgi:hypothetical protein
MPTFFLNYFLTPTAGILFAGATVMSGGEAAVAANEGAVWIVAKSSGLENLLLAQVNQPPQGSSSSSQSGGAVNRVPRPVKIPEPSTLVGLGLVASSLVVTRRRRLKN